MQPWHVYILRCADKTFYTGIATDIERRLNEHNHNDRLAAKYTRVRRPVELVYSETFVSRSVASKREYEIKQLTRDEKLLLIQDDMIHS